jgi:transcriptional regulator of acetoin/glycerol metabolism
LGKKELTDTQKMAAWERFLTGEQQAAVPLAGIVVASWQRSLRLGVNPAGRAAPIAAVGDRYLALRHRNRDLINASADIFGRIESMLAESRCMMLLTDPFGIVLETAGDHGTIDEGERIHLVPGGQWNEDVMGTNGIGTALATGQPAQVHASEHFCEGIKAWTCAAAPIHHPITGKILGVLDISGPPTTYQRGNLSLAVATARQIETSLAERVERERARLLEHCLHMAPSFAHTEMLVLDRSGRVVFANGKPDSFAGLPPFEPDQKIEDWVRNLPESLKKSGNFEPVQLDGRTVGAMIFAPHADAFPRAAAKPVIAVNGAFDGIVGGSPEIVKMVEQATQLAGRRVALLVQGETGTGKEVLVRAIHQLAGPAQPLVVFNCGAASKDLLGAELFGHVRGAFTGALQEGRPGRFELAHGGILCLDEIGELPLDMQPLLLRVLEEGIVYRIGESHGQKVDVRLIAMTNRNLRREVAAGRFRADLFYRLSVTSIEIPPLRARDGDVARLLDYYNEVLSEKHGTRKLRFAGDALRALDAYAWPGNVRELRNFVEGLLLSGADEVTATSLPPEMSHDSAQGGENSGLRLEDTARAAMIRAIENCAGNLSQAARQLGISRSTLHRRLKELRAAE